MKPLIWFDNGQWQCCLDWSLDSSVWGFGDTPTEAYKDWESRMEYPE